MRDYKEQIDQLSGLMEEFKLAEASLTLSNFRVTLKRRLKSTLSPSEHEHLAEQCSTELFESPSEPVAPIAAGHPVSSPMAGIFYLSSSPSSTPFVKVGDVVTVGQTIGLIEAMKVFNEIPSPFTGTVLQILVESGGLVQPGDVILRIG